MKYGYSVNKNQFTSTKYLLYEHEKKSNGRISLDNQSFQIHYKKAIWTTDCVANDFYGWGIMARLENVDGITME